MLKQLVILALLPIFVFSQCESYVPVIDLYPPETYPWHFGAAQEFMLAAGCYETQGNAELAALYYTNATQYFIAANHYLSNGTDHQLRGKAYEKAGDAFVALGQDADAQYYYSLASDEYHAGDFNQDLAALESKIGKQPSYIDITIIAIVIVVILFISALVMLLKGTKEPFSSSWKSKDADEIRYVPEKHEKRIEKDYVRPMAHRKHAYVEHSEPKPFATEKCSVGTSKTQECFRRQPKPQPEQRFLSPREKMRDRIRKKYGLE